MAKVSLNKLATLKNVAEKTIDIHGEKIMIVQYLPIADKISFVEAVINTVLDSNGLSNPIRTETYFYLNFIKFYTDISITDKMLENAAKTYDLLKINDVINTVVGNVPQEEFNEMFRYVMETISHIEKYNTSIVGLIRSVMEDYNNTQLDVREIANNLAKVENSEVLKDV